MSDILTIEQLQWEDAVNTEYRTLLAHDKGKQLYMITRPFHPIKVVYKVNGVTWLLIEKAIEEYNKI